jgi:ribose 5-phosphate isomerase B
MNVAIASDHAGFPLKEEIRNYLANRSELKLLDLGAFGENPSDDYPDFAIKMGDALRSSTAERGILICGSGVGVSVAANKIPGIRAGICHDSYSAHQGVEHDDMNVLVLGSRIIGEMPAREIVDRFLAATFSNEERHRRRLAKVNAIEKEYSKAS